MNARKDAGALQRAYAVLTVKEISADGRTFSGTATTPTPDRVGDIVDPLGASFKNPLPLLWQHDSAQPIGEATFGKPTKNGIPFTAKIASVDEPPSLKERLDTAWASVKTKLVKGVSIGFRGLEYSFMESGGIRFTETEILELSVVTIPANVDATISSIKQFDTSIKRTAAPGVVRLRNLPGASGQSAVVRLRKPNPEEPQGEHQRTDCRVP